MSVRLMIYDQPNNQPLHLGPHPQVVGVGAALLGASLPSDVPYRTTAVTPTEH